MIKCVRNKGRKGKRREWEDGRREGGRNGSWEEEITPAVLWEMVGTMLKMNRGTDSMYRRHTSYDAGLNKDRINEWRREWVSLRYFLEIKMDGLVIGIAMYDIMESCKKEFICSKVGD